MSEEQRGLGGLRKRVTDLDSELARSARESQANQDAGNVGATDGRTESASTRPVVASEGSLPSQVARVLKSAVMLIFLFSAIALLRFALEAIFD